ncbi:MAG: phosphatase PAP2 family protein [Bacteroidetes bacterium]|nr:phosphatase PAP2 family protein [Bacteroidota bacterium]
MIYVPLLPFTAWVCYHYAGEEAVYEYIFALLGVNILCDVGFVLFPIASQLFFDPAQYSVALNGGPFTAMAEWIRANQHFPGGSMPSPHNAAGTVMLLTLWRRHRGWSLVFLPLLVSILPSTVYGRFHYISDGLIGIVLGIVMVRIAAALREAPSAAIPASRIPASRTPESRISESRVRVLPSLRIKSWRMS